MLDNNNLIVNNYFYLIFLQFRQYNYYMLFHNNRKILIFRNMSLKLHLQNSFKNEHTKFFLGYEDNQKFVTVFLELFFYNIPIIFIFYFFENSITYEMYNVTNKCLIAFEIV